MSIANTIIDLAALGILRRLRKLEMSAQMELDFIASSDGAQSIDIPPNAREISLLINGLGQSESAFETSPGNVSIPVDMQVVAGDVLTITYWN